jgi:hypothetical protein
VAIGVSGYGGGSRDRLASVQGVPAAAIVELATPGHLVWPYLAAL